jgi:hypothetical protein
MMRSAKPTIARFAARFSRSTLKSLYTALKLGVLLSRRPRQQIKSLENEPELLVADERQRFLSCLLTSIPSSK